MNFLRSFSFGAFALLASVPSGYASLYGNQLGADIDNADVHLDRFLALDTPFNISAGSEYYTTISVSLAKDDPLSKFVAIGATSFDSSKPGFVKVFERSEPWVIRGVNGEMSFENSGEISVSLSNDGDTLAIGVGTRWGLSNGYVRVFRWNTPENAYFQIGEDIKPPWIKQSYRQAISLSGLSFQGQEPKLAVGGSTGTVNVFNFTNDRWSKYGNDVVLPGSGHFGVTSYSLSLSGSQNVLAVGASNCDANQDNFVAAYVLSTSLEFWNLRGNRIDNPPGCYNTISVAQSELEDNDGLLGFGATGYYNNNYNRVFFWDGENYNQIGNDLDGYGPSDSEGTDVSLNADGTIFAIAMGGSTNIPLYKLFPSGYSNVANVTTPPAAAAYPFSPYISVSLSGIGSSVAIGQPYGYNPNELGYVIVSDTSAIPPRPSSAPSSSATSSVPSSTQAPSSAPQTPVNPTGPGSTGGDPHFKTFSGQFFSYHGECDLVLMESKEFASQLGITVHIRTTRVDNPTIAFSYISRAAVKIGDDVLEVSEDDELFINGSKASADNEVFSIAGYKVTKSFTGKRKRITKYLANFHDGNIIEIRVNTKSGMVYVDVDGSFDDSQGLLGSTQQEALLSRDGTMDLSGHWNTFGEEWQVRNTDPKLFQESRAPQYPASCVYQAATNNLRRHRRRLIENEVTIEEATNACTKSQGQLKDFCVGDVMASGDLGLAEDPFYN